MRIWRLFVMCGVTVRMIPVSLNDTVARGAVRRRSALAERSDVDDSNRRLLTGEDLGLAIVERHDARLRLDVGEPDFLQERRGTTSA